MTPRLIPALAVLLIATPCWAVPAKHPKPPKPAAKPVVELPVTVESLLTQAQDAAGKGDTELALRLAQAAIVADPARPTSYVALGDIYAQTGQPEYARSYYDQALGIDPSEPNALKAIATLNRDHPEDTARANQ